MWDKVQPYAWIMILVLFFVTMVLLNRVVFAPCRRWLSKFAWVVKTKEVLADAKEAILEMLEWA
jgi:hypothetical protein